MVAHTCVHTYVDNYSIVGRFDPKVFVNCLQGDPLSVSTQLQPLQHHYIHVCNCSLCAGVGLPSSLLLSPQERPEAMLLSTLYLTSFLHHVTSLPLMRELLAFILKGQYDGRAVLEQLVLNISSSNTAVSHHGNSQ